MIRCRRIQLRRQVEGFHCYHRVGAARRCSEVLVHRDVVRWCVSHIRAERREGWGHCGTLHRVRRPVIAHPRFRSSVAILVDVIAARAAALHEAGRLSIGPPDRSLHRVRRPVIAHSRFRSPVAILVDVIAARAAALHEAGRLSIGPPDRSLHRVRRPVIAHSRFRSPVAILVDVVAARAAALHEARRLSIGPPDRSLLHRARRPVIAHPRFRSPVAILVNVVVTMAAALHEAGRLRGRHRRLPGGVTVKTRLPGLPRAHSTEDAADRAVGKRGDTAGVLPSVTKVLLSESWRGRERGLAAA